MILRVLDGQETGAQWTLNGPLSCQRVLAASRRPRTRRKRATWSPVYPVNPCARFFESFRPNGRTQTRLSSRRITGRHTETGSRSPTPLGVFFGARGWSIYTSMCGMLRRTECRIDRFGICDYLLIAARWELLCGVRRIEEDAQDDDDAREQLRRSLPILEYLRSVCGIEDRSKPDVSVRYVILASRDANRLDKQRVRVTRSEAIREERHRGIDVKSFVCERISIGSKIK